ncbi:hypothetical protein NMY22_g2051 [Coprinellus aureogranulatus]|nr:hypothetical protein NMY22_g2051 [Coprinellus aureogranulatus]
MPTPSDKEAQTPVVDESAPQPHRHLTPYQRFLHAIRGPMAEFFGTAILVIFGSGAGAAATLNANPSVSPTPKGDFLSINFGWAVGLAIGIWVSDGISNGHINPAMTVAMATWRKFPWRKVPAFILAQFLGGLIGAALVYALYFHAIELYEGPGVRTTATAGIFTTIPMWWMTSAASFFMEFLGTTILSFVVMILTDERNGVAPSPGLYPLAMFVLFLGIGTSLGMTGWALNPARDFGPRVFLAMAGYSSEIWSLRGQYWIWGPIIGPFAGAQAGAFLYNYFLYSGLRKSRSP